MSTKENNDASQNPSSNGQPLVVHHTAPLGAKDLDWGSVPSYGRGAGSDPAVYLHAVRRHWFFGLVIGIALAVAVGASTWFLMPKSYTATALIEVSMRDDVLVFPERSYSAQQEYQVFKETQAQLLKSPFVLMAALRKPEIIALSIVEREKADPIIWLQDELHVSFPGESAIMRVSLSDNDPKEVAKIVQAIVDAYISEIVENDRSMKHRKLADLGNVLARKEQEIRKRRTTLKRLADELGTSDKGTLSLKMQFALQQLNVYRNQLTQVQIELRRGNAQLKATQEAFRRLKESPAIGMELQQMKRGDSICRDLEKTLSGLMQAKAQQSQMAKPGTYDPLSDRLNQQMALIQAQLTEREQQIAYSILESKQSELENIIADLTVRVGLATDAAKDLQDQVNSQEEQFEKIGRSTVELDMMQLELENFEATRKTIAAKREALEVEANSRPRIRARQSPEVPQSYDHPQMKVALSIVGALVGLAFPLFVIIWWDVHKQRINSSEDVAKGLGLPVIGSVPVIPSRAIKRLGAPSGKNQQWNVRLAESIDTIAAKLLRNAAIEKNRVVLITSAVSGEGKTTLATQVAMSLARAGKRTVLVDFDLRRPAVDKAFQLPLHPGVSEALCGENDVASLPQATGLPNLEVVTAGRCDRHALQALANGGDKQLFEEFRDNYEFVIVDGSPILPVADSRYISQHVDSVVLSIFRDFSRVPKVMAACEILEAFGVHDIEAVVTSSSEDGYGVVDTVVQSVQPSA